MASPSPPASCAPKARGASGCARPTPAQPLVDPNFFGDPEDLRLTIAGVRRAREILAQPPLRRARSAPKSSPAPTTPTDGDLAAHAGQTVKTNYHPVGTARMGADDDPMAVVAAELTGARRRGPPGGRLLGHAADPAGNTNAPAMAIGSKAASLIAGI